MKCQISNKWTMTIKLSSRFLFLTLRWPLSWKTHLLSSVKNCSLPDFSCLLFQKQKRVSKYFLAEMSVIFFFHVCSLCNIADRNHILVILREKAASKAVKIDRKQRVRKGLKFFTHLVGLPAFCTPDLKNLQKFQFTEKWASDLTY